MRPPDKEVLDMKEVLSVKETAELLELSKTTIRSYCDDGTLKDRVTPGGHRQVYADSAFRLCKTMQQKGDNHACQQRESDGEASSRS